MTAMLSDPSFWVAIAFVIFVGLLGYLGVHRQLTRALDNRADRIKAELDEARRLKDEAMALLQEYQRRREAAGGADPRLLHPSRLGGHAGPLSARSIQTMSRTGIPSSSEPSG